MDHSYFAAPINFDTPLNSPLTNDESSATESASSTIPSTTESTFVTLQSLVNSESVPTVLPEDFVEVIHSPISEDDDDDSDQEWEKYPQLVCTDDSKDGYIIIPSDNNTSGDHFDTLSATICIPSPPLSRASPIPFFSRHAFDTLPSASASSESQATILILSTADGESPNVVAYEVPEASSFSSFQPSASKTTKDKTKEPKTKKKRKIQIKTEINDENSQNLQLQPLTSLNSRINDTTANNNKTVATTTISNIHGPYVVKSSKKDNENEDDSKIDLEVLESFANRFRAARIEMDFTQNDVSQSLDQNYGNEFSQTTISRFEALALSFNNMKRLMPVLDKWLENMKKRNPNTRKPPPIALRRPLSPALGSSSSQTSSSRPSSPLLASNRKLLLPTGDSLDLIPATALRGRKRKRRAVIDADLKDSLLERFNANVSPKVKELKDISMELGLDYDVVRIWYCNKRAKLKRGVLD